MAQYASYSGYGSSGGGGGGGVPSVNGITGAVVILPGSGSSVTTIGNDIIVGNTRQYIVQKYTLTPTDIAAKSVTLSQAPTTANLTRLTVINGPEQDYGPDFVVSGTTLSWSGLFLDGVLVSGDKLIVSYN